MQTFTSVLLALAAANAVSASPFLRRDTCGVAPSATGSRTPIAQPTDCETASACQVACAANDQCESFLFGMVDNAIKCELFPVPAAQLPKQDSQNVVAYDKACSSVPAVTPTASNPTGQEQSNANKGTGVTQNGNGKQSPTSTPSPQAAPQSQSKAKSGDKLAARNTCGGAPAGSNANQAPLSQPDDVTDASQCLAKCKANTSCKSFEFGTEKNVKVCRLFSVPPAQVPAPTAGQSFQVYDVGCAM